MNSVMHCVYLVSGVIALAFTLILFLYKEKKRILQAKLSCDVLWTINYFVEGSIAYTGALQNLICMLRETIFLFRAKGKRWADSPLWCIMFCLFYMIMPFFTWAGWFSVLPSISSMISSVSLFVKNPQLTRWLMIPSQIVSIIYVVMVGNLFGVLSGSFMIVSAVSGIILRKKKSGNTV